MVIRTLLLGLLLGGLGGGATSGSTRGGSTTTTARGDGGELGRALGDELQTDMLTIFVHSTTQTPVCARTSLTSLPFSSARRVLRRPASASMPTDSRTAVMSLAEGEALPPSWRRR